MKKNFKYALLSATALMGAVSFSACSSSDDVADLNPTYNGETVKTQFAITIPKAGNPTTTRMASGAAQEDGAFSGMKNIMLYPFKTATAVSGTSDIMQAPIALSAFNALDKTGYNNAFHGKVYQDVEIPVGTKSFLFYGQKTDGQGGELTPTYGNTGTPASNISFELVNITNNTFANVVANDTKAKAVLDALNDVATTLINQQTSASSASHSIAPTLEQFLNKLKENTAGSANSVLLLMEDLYNSFKNNTDSYSSAIVNAIETHFTTTSDPFSWTTANNFPQDLGLPDGAASVEWQTGTSKFIYKEANINGMGGNELTNYVKPAALFYTVNTPIKVDTKPHAEEYNGTTMNNWSNVVSLYQGGTEVTPSSRAVVLQNPINYAVAQLKTTVVISSTPTTLKANDGTNEAGPVYVDVTKPSGGYSFPVTGILVGGQKNVLWNFTTNTTADSKVVYDPVMTTSPMVATTTASTPNYTLLLETVDNTDQVMAVEFVNDGEDFFGVDDKLIPHGSKFYLVADLKISPTSPNTTNTKNLTKVFQQDYQTVVELTIGELSLSKAYNVIPDLRTPEMELGLSVDLTWNDGMVFNVTF